MNPSADYRDAKQKCQSRRLVVKQRTTLEIQQLGDNTMVRAAAKLYDFAPHRNAAKPRRHRAPRSPLLVIYTQVSANIDAARGA
jgi:hypothetical protein